MTTVEQPNVGSALGTPLGGVPQRTLRSASRAQGASAGINATTREESEKDRALEIAEEKMLLEEDEEIASYDESGNPVADTAKVERRNLTVALVNSVVETSGSNGDETPQHSYGLRRRKRAGSHSSHSPISPRSPRTRKTKPTEKAAQELKDKVEDPGEGGDQGEATAAVQPKPVQAKPQPAPMQPQPTLAPISAVVEEKKVQTAKTPAPVGQSSAQVPALVPNPLLNGLTTPNVQGEASLKQEGPVESGSRNRALSVSFLSVPCPISATSTSKTEQKEDSGNSVAVENTTWTTSRRGRIFSIDIDPAGLDFPDIGLGTLDPQAVFDGTSSLPQGKGAQAIPAVASSTEPAVVTTAIPLRPNLPEGTSADIVFPTGTGRDRAMSFEFFSFGINADEPLPDTDISKSSTRPRGDSIIFDPCSFRDGGILEESSIMRGSRTNSLDLTGVLGGTPVADSSSQPNKLLPHPGAPGSSTVPPMPGAKPVLTAPRPAPVPAAAYSRPPMHGITGKPPSELATLPSSLANGSVINGGMSHATFQMELLNKDGRIGIYLPDARRARIAKFHSKRKMRIWRKRIKYDCRKKLADSRPRIKGRFVKRSDMEE